MNTARSAVQDSPVCECVNPPVREIKRLSCKEVPAAARSFSLGQHHAQRRLSQCGLKIRRIHLYTDKLDVHAPQALAAIGAQHGALRGHWHRFVKRRAMDSPTTLLAYWWALSIGKKSTHRTFSVYCHASGR